MLQVSPIRLCHSSGCLAHFKNLQRRRDHLSNRRALVFRGSLMAAKWELYLNRDDRLAVAKASRLLRKVYDLSTYKMARGIGFSIYYLSQVEREDKYPAGDNVIRAIANYFKLEFSHLVEIGNNCKTPIDCFLYLQKIGRI